MSKYEDVRVVSVLGGGDTTAQPSTNDFVTKLLLCSTKSESEEEPSVAANQAIIPEQAVGTILCGIWGSDVNHSVPTADTNAPDTSLISLCLFLQRVDQTTHDTGADSLPAVNFKMSMVAAIVASVVVADMKGGCPVDTLDMIGKIAHSASQLSSQLPSSMAVTNVPKIVYTVDIANADNASFASTEGRLESAPGTFKLLGHFLTDGGQRQLLADRIDSFFGNTDEEYKIHIVNTLLDLSTTPQVANTDISKEDVDYLSWMDFSKVVIASLAPDEGDADEPKADDVPSVTYLQTVTPLLRAYIAATVEIDSPVKQERVSSLDKSVSAAVGVENDDWDGENVEWTEASRATDLDDGMEISSHTLKSVDLNSSPAPKVNPVKLAATVDSCMEVYRASMLEHLLDPATTPATESLLRGAYSHYSDTLKSEAEAGKCTTRCGHFICCKMVPTY